MPDDVLGVGHTEVQGPTGVGLLKVETERQMDTAFDKC